VKQSKLGDVVVNWKSPNAPNFQHLTDNTLDWFTYLLPIMLRIYFGHTAIMITSGITCLMVPLIRLLSIFGLFPNSPNSQIHIS
jgi:hypothetical protein